MDDTRLGWVVRLGSTVGILQKIDFDLGRFWIGEREFAGMWHSLKFEAPPADKVWIARSAKVSMIVTQGEHDTLIRAGAAHGS